MATAKTAAKKSVKKATNAKAKNAKAKAKEIEKKAKPAGRDYLGSRNGSGCAKINAAISAKTPKSPRELHEETGETLVLCRNHVQTLLRKELIERKDDGVVLTKNHKKVVEKLAKERAEK